MAKKLNARQEVFNIVDQLKRKAGQFQNTLVRNVGDPVRYSVQKAPVAVQQRAIQTIGNPVRTTIQRSPVFNPRQFQFRPDVLAKPLPPKFVGGNQALTDYAQNQIRTPLYQGIKQMQRKGAGNKAMGALGIAQGIFSATPQGALFNIGTGTLAASTRSLRTGEPFQKALTRSVLNPTSVGSEGLGLSGAAALAVDIVTGGPRGTVKTAQSLGQFGKNIRNLKGINPRAFKMHPDDLQEAKSALDILRGQVKAGTADKRYALKTVQNLLDAYAPGYKTSKNAKAYKVLENLIQTNEELPRDLRTPLPKMGLVGEDISRETLGLRAPRNIDSPRGTTQKATSEISSRQPGIEAIRDTSGLPLTNSKSFPSSGNIPQPQAVSKEVNDYLKQLQGAQRDAGAGGPQGVIARTKNIFTDIKKAMVDSVSPYEDALSVAEKKYKFKVLPKNDVRLQTDRVYRARTLAAQFAEDNGLTKVIQDAPDLNALNQYMIAKQARRVEEFGKETGRDLLKDEQLIRELSPRYEQYAQQVNQYSQKLLDYSVDSGLVSKELAGQLKQKYPEYVPLQRIFNELERSDNFTGTKAVASLSRQSVVQKLEGSEREIQSPIESLLLKTQTAFEQGEKNKAARMLASYSELPGMSDLIRPLREGGKAPHTISFIDDGVKRAFETTPEIEAAAKNLDHQQMNIVLKVISIPTRTLQLGATGLNLPFLVTNLAKDQVTAFINSNKALKTSIANPVNFTAALFSALKHDDLYKEVIRNAAGGTSFDIARQAPSLTVKRIRAGKNIGSKVAFTATRPGELLRTVENLVARGEELTRVQQYRGTLKALLKEGRTLEDAKLLAAKAARENTANFARHGDVSKVVNYVIPFFNAGIQGARVFSRNAKTRPVQTGSKLAVGIFMPVVATTIWNLSDPKRKEVYDDIAAYEKETNIIIIPNNPQQDERGRWGVIKVPLPPGLSNLGSMVRRPIEAANGLDPLQISEMASNLFTATTSFDVSSSNKVLSTFTPQAIKPFIESATNTNLFTGRNIVPQSMQDLPPGEQVKDYTSGTARLLAKTPIGQLMGGGSPLKVESFLRTTTGGAGSQALNLADTALNKLGVIPEEQIGGESAGSALDRRFRRATGGNVEQRAFKEVQDAKQASAVVKAQQKRTGQQVYDELKQLPREVAFQKAEELKEANPGAYKEMVKAAQAEKLGLSSSEKSMLSLGVEDGTRAKFLYKKFNDLETKEEKAAYWEELSKKKIITKKVRAQLLYLFKNNGSTK